MTQARAEPSGRARFCVAAVVLPALVLAQNYVFGPNVRVNEGTPGSYFSSTYAPGQHLIAARGDTVYLVWRDDRGGWSHICFARSNNAGQSFLPNVRVDNTAPGCATALSTLAVDDSGGIHVCWLNANLSNCDFVYYGKSTDGGESFSPAIRACDSLHRSQYAEPSMAIGRLGRRIYVLRAEGRYPIVPACQLHLSRSTDGGSTFPTPDVRVNPDTTSDMLDPTIAILGDTVVLIAWTTGAGVMFARSCDGGDSFEPTILISDSMTGADDNPSVACDSSGCVYVVWSGPGDGLGIAVSNDSGRSFSHERAIPGTHWGRYPSAWLASGGNLYIAWQFRMTDGDFWEVRMAHSTDGGMTFSQPANPSDGPMPTNEMEPTICTNEGGRVFFARTDTRHSPSGFNSDTYFATGTLTGIEETPSDLTRRLSLYLPNSPAHGMLRMRHELPVAGALQVDVFDRLGRRVAALRNGRESAGIHGLTWNGVDDQGRTCPAGVYVVRFSVSETKLSKQFIYVR